MTLRVSDWQSEGDLDSIRNACYVLENYIVKDYLLLVSFTANIND